MELESVLRVIQPVGPFGPSELLFKTFSTTPFKREAALREAEENYHRACEETDHVLSDWAYWAAVGSEIACEVLVNVLRAAERVEPANLPDIPAPDLANRVVMDQQGLLTKWGKQIAEAAGVIPIERPQFKKKDGCRCVQCSL